MNHDAYWEGLDDSDNPYDEEKEADARILGNRAGERPVNTTTTRMTNCGGFQRKKNLICFLPVREGICNRKIERENGSGSLNRPMIKTHDPSLSMIKTVFIPPNFLGFTHFCGTTPKGAFTIKRQSISKRLRAKLQEIKLQLTVRMHATVTK